MSAWSNHKRLWIAAWILAGLTVLGINAHLLKTLLDEPAYGLSSQRHSADRAFAQYRSFIADRTETITSGMDRLADLFAAQKATQANVATETAADGDSEARAASARVALPDLEGLINQLAEDGTVQWMAVMEGHVWRRGDRIRELTIARIDHRGVLLVDGKRSWFVAAPEIEYTLAVQ